MKRLLISLAYGLALTVGVLALLAEPDADRFGVQVAGADAGDVYCVVPDGPIGTFVSCRQIFTTVQAAVDAANGGEEIWLATGRYSDLHQRAEITQVVYITKTVSLRGGYSSDFTIWDPVSYPTTLDAQGQGRVLYISGDITVTVEGLNITGGDATDLGHVRIGSSNAIQITDFGGGAVITGATVSLKANKIYGNVAYRANEAGDNKTTAAGKQLITPTGISPSQPLITPTWLSSWGSRLIPPPTLLSGRSYHPSAKRLPANGDINGYGGGLYIAGGMVTLEKNEFMSNTALSLNRSGDTSGYAYGGGLAAERSQITLTNNIIQRNLANETKGGGSGGGMYVSNGHIKLDGNTVRDNIASLYSNDSRGGGLALFGPYILLHDNLIMGNTAVVTIVDRPCPYWCSGDSYLVFGGGLALYGETLILRDNAILSNTGIIQGSLMENNQSGTNGGGLWIGGDQVTLENNLIQGNVGTVSSGWGNGGGMLLDAATITLTNNLIQDNIATVSGGWGSGGGMLLGGETIMLQGNAILSNTGIAEGTGPYSPLAFGGGLSIEGGQATLENNLIQGNVGAVSAYLSWGGGILLYDVASITLTDNLIRANIAAVSGNEGDGGGIMGYTDVLTESIMVLADNTIQENIGNLSGSSVGGGVFLALSNLEPDDQGTLNIIFNDNKILSNTATLSNTFGAGGGLVLSGGEATLNNNYFQGNVANTYGGGLYLYNSQARLTNTVIIDNYARPGGSGLMVEANSNVHLLQTTIARNRGGDGSGLYIIDDSQDPNSGYYEFNTVMMTNTILVSHTIGISVTSGNTVTLNSVLWHQVPITISVGATATVVVNNVFSDDPRFAADGYHLRPGSPAIDRGVVTGVETNIDGQPRSVPPDLGADEYWARGLYLPLMLR